MEDFLRINCERHHNYFITHGCSHLDCKKEVLFCSGCFLENLDHANEHKDAIVPLERFLLSFYHAINSVNERLEPFHMISSQRGPHMRHYSEFLAKQNMLIDEEMKEISGHLNLFLTKLKSKCVDELNQLQNDLEENYNLLEECFRSTEISFLDMSDPNEFYQNILAFNTPAQVSSYLTNLRNVLQNLNDPAQSLTLNKLSNTANVIQAFYERPENLGFPLMQTVQTHVRALFSEIDNKVTQYLGEIGKYVREVTKLDKTLTDSGLSANNILELKERKTTSIANKRRNAGNSDIRNKENVSRLPHESSFQQTTEIKTRSPFRESPDKISSQILDYEEPVTHSKELPFVYPSEKQKPTFPVHKRTNSYNINYQITPSGYSEQRSKSKIGNFENFDNVSGNKQRVNSYEKGFNIFSEDREARRFERIGQNTTIVTDSNSTPKEEDSSRTVFFPMKSQSKAQTSSRSPLSDRFFQNNNSTTIRYNETQPSMKSIDFENAFETSNFGRDMPFFVRKKDENAFSKAVRNFQQSVVQKSYVSQKGRGNITTAPLFRIKAETSSETLQNNSCLCTVSLGEGFIACGGKGNIVYIFKVVKSFGRQKYELELLEQLQNKNDPFTIWSLAHLTPRRKESISQYSYLAVGTESSNIYIWRLNTGMRVADVKLPISVLKKPGPTGEVITSILGLEGSNYLVSGDSEGRIYMWDFTSGKLTNQYTYHKGQINSLAMYNNGNNFAAASFDCSISLWRVLSSASDFADMSSEANLVCERIIKNDFYALTLTTIPHNQQLIVFSDSSRCVRVLNTEDSSYIIESGELFHTDSVYEILFLDIGNMNKFVLCFTKNRLIILDAETLELYQEINNEALLNNSIALTMSACLKAVFVNCEETEDQVQIAIVDQSNRSGKIISLLSLQYTERG